VPVFVYCVMTPASRRCCNAVRTAVRPLAAVLLPDKILRAPSRPAKQFAGTVVLGAEQVLKQDQGQADIVAAEVERHK